jgi:hypothetical protein
MNKFEKLYLYKNEDLIIIIGSIQDEKINKIYTIDRNKLEIDIISYPKVYDYE